MVLNPDAEQEAQKKVELLTVKQKLVNSDPYMPSLAGGGPRSEYLAEGIWGMVIGLIMVIGLDYLRLKG